MGGPFPPSSPVAGSGAIYDQDFRQDSSAESNLATDIHGPGTKDFSANPFLEKAQMTRGGKFQAQLKSTNHQYPTPQPSSSIGRSSSPIRGISADSPSASSVLELQGPVAIANNQPITIELDSRGSSRLAIGRKKSVCDIVLPSKKNISRQHAFISYVPAKNQVKLECNGTNGIVVMLPCELKCQLIIKDHTKQCYELCTNSFNEKCVAHDKMLEKSHKMTSFVLLKGESVTMPFVVGTLIDFRQAEAMLSLKQSGSAYEVDDNSTETEDEIAALMTKSDDFHEGSSTPEKFIKVALSPSTLKISENHTRSSPVGAPLFEENFEKTTIPLTQQVPRLTCNVTPLKPFQPETPTTPKKLKGTFELRNEAQETPLTKDSKSGTNANPLRRRKPTVSTPLNMEDEQKRKQQKPNIEIESTSGEPIAALKERGINCVELQRVLANHLAFANIQQTPLFQLQEVNSKTSKISREELRALLAEESCIGVIYREGKDAAGKPLDEEYYYDVENDPDIERRNLVTALKGGRSGLRSCRRTHKQYFWKKPAK